MFFPITFILIGVFLLVMIPILIIRIKNDPISVLRPQWRDHNAKGFATALGIFIIILALVGGIWTIAFGISLL